MLLPVLPALYLLAASTVLAGKHLLTLMGENPSPHKNEWHTTLAKTFEDQYGLFFLWAKHIVQSTEDAYDVVRK
jgi:formate-dependent nitrite reductase membrane component NrfD